MLKHTCDSGFFNELNAGVLVVLKLIVVFKATLQTIGNIGSKMVVTLATLQSPEHIEPTRATFRT